MSIFHKKTIIPASVTKINEIFKELNESIEDLTDDFCEYNRPKTLFFEYVHLSKQGNKFVFELLQKRNILN